jgi:hypothetical protein
MASKTATKVTVPAAAMGDIALPGRGIKVDEQFYQDLVEGLEALTAEGYYPPILKMHMPDLEEAVESIDGDPTGPRAVPVDPEEDPDAALDDFVFGLITGVVRQGDEILYETQVVEPLAEAIDEGMTPYWSPAWRFNWTHPNTGEVLKVAPKHHAFVRQPHQKNIAPAGDFYELSELADSVGQYQTHSSGLLLQEQPMPNGKNKKTKQGGGDGEGDDQMVSILKEIKGSLGRMEQQNKAIMDNLGVEASEDGQPATDGGDGQGEGELGEDAPVEDGDEPVELAEYKRRIKQLENRQIREKCKQAGIQDSEAVEEIVELSESDRVEAVGKLVDRVASGDGREVVLSEERGSTGEADVETVDPSLSEGDALELAEQKLDGTDAWEKADSSARAKMKIDKAQALRGEK